MLQLKNITLTLTKDSRTLLSGFSFALNRGDKAVIIGEEGDGKSTLLKLIYDPSMIEDYCEWSGEVVSGGLSDGFLPQELPDKYKQMSSRDYFASLPSFTLHTQGELAEIASQLGLPFSVFTSDQLTGTFSGGERVKLQLAGVLIGKPEVLLLDEPSNDLDIETLQWLEDFINSAGKPVLFISHDQTLIENTANVVIHLEQLRKKSIPRHTVARMSYSEYMSSRSSAFEHQAQMAKSDKDEFTKKQARHQKIMEKVEHRQETISRGDPHGGRLLKKKMKSVKAQERRLEKEKENLVQMPDTEQAILPVLSEGLYVPAGKSVLELNLPLLEAGGRVLSRDINLNVRGGEHICIIGRNGAGKSTLIKHIAALLLERRDIKAGYMPQSYEDSADMRKTPVQYLSEGRDSSEVTRARTFLGSMKFTSDEMTGKIAALSGGQKAKLLFIGMIYSGCNVLILDEPTRNLSPLSAPAVRKLLRDFKGAVISVSHDRKYISEVCDKVYRLGEEGLIMTNG
ncbi:MAG: ATP-binding cassette domain-containing protein [Eubacteriales bacterium]